MKIKVKYELNKFDYVNSLKKLYWQSIRGAFFELVILVIVIDLLLALTGGSLVMLLEFSIGGCLLSYVYFILGYCIFKWSATKKGKYFFGYGDYSLEIDNLKMVKKFKNEKLVLELKNVTKVLVIKDNIYVYFKNGKSSFSKMVESFRKDYFEKKDIDTMLKYCVDKKIMIKFIK